MIDIRNMRLINQSFLSCSRSMFACWFVPSSCKCEIEVLNLESLQLRGSDCFLAQFRPCFATWRLLRGCYNNDSNNILKIINLLASTTKSHTF